MWVRSTDTLALDVAEAALPAIEVYKVEAQMEISQRRKEKVASWPNLTVTDKELALTEAFSGEKRSILSVTACSNHLVQIRVADLAGSSVWRDTLLQSFTSDESRSIPGGRFYP